MNHEIFSIPLILLSFIATAYVFSKYNFLSHVNDEVISKRYYFIDGLRGFAAVFVISAHIWRLSFYNLELEPFSFMRDGWEVDKGWLLGAFGVQIFFCITGFLFVDQIIKRNRKFDWDRFYIARVKRLSPLYLFSITFALVVMWALSDSTRISITEIYESIKLYAFGFWGFGVGTKILSSSPEYFVGQIWTLPYEWRFYFLMPIFCILLSKKPSAILSSIAAIVVIALTLYVEKGIIWGYFFTGALSAFIFNKYNPKKLARFSALLLMAVTLSVYILLLSKNEKYGALNFFLASAFFISLVIARPSIFKWKPLVYIGEATYSVYLLHSTILILIAFFISKILNVVSIGPWVVILVYAGSSIVICSLSLLSFKYIEYPFLKKK